MQARTIITVLDFLLAQNTPPVVLWTCRRRLLYRLGNPSGRSSCRRDANRAAQGRVPFRVKSAARVELIVNVSGKWVVASLVGKA